MTGFHTHPAASSPASGGGVGLNPLVSTQFNFADVGVNVDITAESPWPQ